MRLAQPLLEVRFCWRVSRILEDELFLDFISEEEDDIALVRFVLELLVSKGETYEMFLSLMKLILLLLLLLIFQCDLFELFLRIFSDIVCT